LSHVYFTDRDLGKRFPEILRASGLNVERHADHFSPETPDAVWLEEVGKRGWIALTHDQRIRYKPNERDAVMRHGVALLVVVGKAPFPDLARAFVATLPRIESFLAEHEPPFIAKVYRPAFPDVVRGAAVGRVELWHPRG
jgi:PIN like domain